MNSPCSAESKFAPAERLACESLRTIGERIAADPLIVEMLYAVPDVTMLLDHHRQIVYCNRNMLALLGLTSYEEILGRRPGEALGCARSENKSGGCGTTEFCMECGAVNAILYAQKGQPSIQECRMHINTGTRSAALDLRIWARPLHLADQDFVLMAARDIADEKRRNALERTFFHDILNDVSILQTYIANVKEGFIDEKEDVMGNIGSYSARILDDIRAQKDLLSAETGTLLVAPSLIKTHGLLQEAAAFYRRSQLARTHPLKCVMRGPETDLFTDRSLLWRIIGNLIKNALEAAEPNSQVTLSVEQKQEHTVFSVHNQGFMPSDIQHQIFQRSFSTKGPGRGIGTYSVKLFTEEYLKGRADFISSPEAGTTFSVSLKNL